MEPTPVVVVATIYPSQTHRAEVAELYEQVISEVHTEDGCELYALHEMPDRLVMIEKWASREALAAHADGAALAHLRPRLEGKLDRPSEVQLMDAHPAGTATQGAL
jgi:quinol monooxygenase YgiN